MKITLAGTASGEAAADRASSALFIESESGHFLIDCGEGTVRQLIRLGLPFEDLQTVFISHMHPDHGAGLIGLIQNLYLKGRTDPLTVYMPAGAIGRMTTVLETFHIRREKLPFELHFSVLHDQSWMALGLFKIVCVYNTHLESNRTDSKSGGPDSFSFVLSEKQRRCVYTADVRDLDHLSGWTRDIDVLISECTHISVMEAIHFAEKQNIREIVLTHIPPETDVLAYEVVARRHFENLTFAQDGTVVEL